MKKYFFFFTLLVLISACHKDNSHVFSKNKVGELTGKMTPEEVRATLKNENLLDLKKVSGIVDQSIMEVTDEKTGRKQMILIFQPGKDTLELYAVEIVSPSFRSNKGMGLKNNFEQWRKNHRIKRAEKTLRHVVVYVDDLNAILEFNNEDLVDQARNKTLSEADIDWIQKDATPRRIILFMN